MQKKVCEPLLKNANPISRENKTQDASSATNPRLRENDYTSKNTKRGNTNEP